MKLKAVANSIIREYEVTSKQLENANTRLASFIRIGATEDIIKTAESITNKRLKLHLLKHFEKMATYYVMESDSSHFYCVVFELSMNNIDSSHGFFKKFCRQLLHDLKAAACERMM